jgi:hypothetical protein
MEHRCWHEWFATNRIVGHNTTDNTIFWVVIMSYSSRNFALHQVLTINITVFIPVVAFLLQLQDKAGLFELRAAGINFVVCFRRWRNVNVYFAHRVATHTHTLTHASVCPHVEQYYAQPSLFYCSYLAHTGTTRDDKAAFQLKNL